MTHRTLRSLTTGVALLAFASLAHAQGEDTEPASDKPAPEAADSSKPAEPAADASAKASTDVKLSSAPVEVAPVTPPPSEGLNVKINDWSLGLYGFAALNVMHDSTQSYGPAAGNARLERVGTFKGNNNQLQFTALLTLRPKNRCSHHRVGQSIGRHGS